MVLVDEAIGEVVAKRPIGPTVPVLECEH